MKKLITTVVAAVTIAGLAGCADGDNTATPSSTVQYPWETHPPYSPKLTKPSPTPSPERSPETEYTKTQPTSTTKRVAPNGTKIPTVEGGDTFDPTTEDMYVESARLYLEEGVIPIEMVTAKQIADDIYDGYGIRISAAQARRIRDRILA